MTDWIPSGPETCGKVEMTYENIVVETHGRVGVITLNRPKQLNALNDALMNELRDALTEFDSDDAIGAIVLTGRRKGVCGGRGRRPR